MNKEQIIAELKERKLKDIIELIEDAEAGYLEELELVESVGLVYGDELNRAVLELLQSLGVELIYVTDDEE
jgi:vacuolar-type H+-ATPase subunit I/STV1